MSSILVAGCGYVGRRLVGRLHRKGERNIHALVSRETSAAKLEGDVDRVIVLDLDRSIPPDIVPPDVAQLYYFIPPPSEGVHDPRLPRLLAWLEKGGLPRRILLISTSGVYGDCNGEIVAETRPTAPVAERARRRLDAEQQLRHWADSQGVETVILRVAGIYGPGRLPLARLRKGLPMVAAADAPWTNRVHVDDLVTVCEQAMNHAPAGEIYNVSDGQPGNMTDYFNQVADATGLPRPPVIPLDAADGKLSPGMMSYLRESRRLDNRRMLSIPGVSLRFPTLESGLAASIDATDDPND
jgi:nucleoside-diphosphate-sugar epimerase